MKSFFYKHSIVSALIISVAILSACKDDNEDWGKKAEKEIQKTEEAYAQAFESIFGKISPNQSWDFTNIGKETNNTRTDGVKNAVATSFSSVGGSIEDYYYVTVTKDNDDNEVNLSQWLDVYLKESQDNRSKGKALSFAMPSDGLIDLIPIYQGWSVSAWDMHMVVTPTSGNPIDINFWTKNDGLEVLKRKLGWDEARVLHIKNQKDGQYLRVIPACNDLAQPESYIQVNTSKDENDNDAYRKNQFIIQCNRGFKEWEWIEIEYKYQVAATTHFGIDLHKTETKDSAPYQDWKDQYFDIFDYTNNSWSKNSEGEETPWKYNRVELTQSNSLENTVKIKYQIPGKNSDGSKTGAAGYNVITFNLDVLDSDPKSNTYKFTEIRVKDKDGKDLVENGYLWSDNNTSFLKRENGVNNNNSSNCNITVPDSYIARTLNNTDPWIGLTSPYYPFRNHDDLSTTPYARTNEMGFNFAVVSIYHGKVGGTPKTGKYLYTFADKPENGGFLTVVGSGSLRLIKLADANFTDGSIKEVFSYDAPYMDNKFLKIGDYYLRRNPSDGKITTVESKTLTADGNNHDFPWEVNDNNRAMMLDPDNGYCWSFESRYRYRYEAYAIGCTSDGNRSSYDGLSNSVYTKFSNSTKEEWQNVYAEYQENTIGKTIRGKTYHFDFSTYIANIPNFANAKVTFYWETLTPWDRRNRATGKYLYSDKANQLQMLAITGVKAPAISGKNVVMVGCEAGDLAESSEKHANWSDTDWDYNDVVFLLATNVPPTYIERQGEDEVIEKRYMVEDLGNTDDIDFNDMVVDVREVRKIIYIYDETTNKKVGEKYSDEDPYQEVIVRALGGTLPFDFYMQKSDGNYVKIFSKSDLVNVKHTITNELGMYNTGTTPGSTSAQSNGLVGTLGTINYDANYGTFRLEDNYWNYNTNNVMFRVYRKAGNKEYLENNEDADLPDLTNGYYTHDIVFPDLGEVPHIIAFPVNKAWRNERRLCCWDWINDIEPALWEWPENPVSDSYDNQSPHPQTFKYWYDNQGSDYLEWVNKNFGTNAKTEMEKWLIRKQYKK